MSGNLNNGFELFPFHLMVSRRFRPALPCRFTPKQKKIAFFAVRRNSFLRRFPQNNKKSPSPALSSRSCGKVCSATGTLHTFSPTVKRKGIRFFSSSNFLFPPPPTPKSQPHPLPDNLFQSHWFHKIGQYITCVRDWFCLHFRIYERSNWRRDRHIHHRRTCKAPGGWRLSFGWYY